MFSFLFLMPMSGFRFPEANPVLVYELRQVFRNRLMFWLVAIYLGFSLLFFGGGLFYEKNWVIAHVLSHGIFYDNLGFQLAFGMMCAYYGCATILLVGFAVYRLVFDRVQEDASLYTTLSPWRMVFGKLQFGAVVGILFASLTFPFLTVAYQMRGIDVPLIFYGMFWFFCMTQLHYHIAITFLSGAKTVPQALARCLPMLVINFVLAFFFYIGLINMIMMDWLVAVDWTLGVFLPTALFGFVVFILFLLSTVQLAPENANRMMPVRIALSAIYLVFLIVLGGSFVFEPVIKSMFPLFDRTAMLLVIFYDTFGTLVLPCFFLIFVCEREEYSARIRRTIPRTIGRRLLSFPFYTGAANAMVWSVGTIGVSFLIGLLATGRSDIIAGFYRWDRELLNTASYNLLFFDYAATTLLLYNLVLYRWISREWNWTPVAGFFLFLAVATFLDVFFSPMIGMNSIAKHLMVLPFLPIPVGGTDKYITQQIVIGLVWLAVLTIVALPWLRRHFADFQSASSDV